MKELPIPADRAAAAKKQRALRRNCMAVTVFFFICAAVAILSLIGLLVCVMVFELKGLGDSPLFPILAGSFAGGALFFALGAFGLSKLSAALSDSHTDFAERCDGEDKRTTFVRPVKKNLEEFLQVHEQSLDLAREITKIIGEEDACTFVRIAERIIDANPLGKEEI